MDNYNKLNIALVLLLGVMLSINFVSALGVNAPYWNENPLKMYAGETREVSFPLVNSVNDPSTDASVVLTQGTEIAQIISGDKYTVAPGQNDKSIDLRITIPSNANIGDSYPVNIKVSYLPAAGDGNIQLNIDYNVVFPVQVVSQGQESAVVSYIPTAGPINATEIGKLVTILIITFISALIFVIVIILIVKAVKKKSQGNSSTNMQSMKK